MNDIVLDRGELLAAEVFEGKDGFLFHRWNLAVEQLCEGLVLSPDDLRYWVNTLEFRFGWCQMMGIHYYVQIIPERHAVYDDCLPDGMHLAPERPLTQLRAALSPTERRNFLYPREALKRGRQTEETFFRTDIHPSRYGAYLCYRSLAESIGPAFFPKPIEEDELVRSAQTRRILGDLGVRTASEPTEDITELGTTRRFRGDSPFASKHFTEGQVQIFTNADQRLPKLVLFRDSNATHMINPFLMAHFSRIVAIGAWGHFFPEIIRQEQPDLVISSLAERWIGTPARAGTTSPVALPNNLSQLTFERFTGLPIPLPC